MEPTSDEQRCFLESLAAGTKALGIALGSAEAGQMWKHFCLLLQANRRINLTRIVEPDHAAVAHYADSLAVLAWTQQARFSPECVLDVGTGGGFPAVPLAIACPNWQLTAIDGTAKKVKCVAEFISQLGLDNCTASWQRAERWQEPPKFDLVLFRAIAPLEHCLKKARRVCRPGCTVICYKSDPLGDDEMQLPDKVAYEPLQPWRYKLTFRDQTLRRQLCVYRRTDTD